MNEQEIRTYITSGQGKFSVNDGEFGKSVVEVEAVDGERINWRLYNQRIASESIAYNDDSIEGFIWYLLEAEAKQHWTVNA